MNLTNKQYDTLKMIALLVLPIGTFISTFLAIWGLPAAEQVQQTFIALDVLCGALVTGLKARWDKEHGDAGK